MHAQALLLSVPHVFLIYQIFWMIRSLFIFIWILCSQRRGEDWQVHLLGPDRSEQVEARWAGYVVSRFSTLSRPCPVEPSPLLIPRMHGHVISRKNFMCTRRVIRDQSIHKLDLLFDGTSYPNKWCFLFNLYFIN
jgi:hypothetical protein